MAEYTNHMWQSTSTSEYMYRSSVAGQSRRQILCGPRPVPRFLGSQSRSRFVHFPHFTHRKCTNPVVFPLSALVSSCFSMSLPPQYGHSSFNAISTLGFKVKRVMQFSEWLGTLSQALMSRRIEASTWLVRILRESHDVALSTTPGDS